MFLSSHFRCLSFSSYLHISSQQFLDLCRSPVSSAWEMKTKCCRCRASSSVASPTAALAFLISWKFSEGESQSSKIRRIFWLPEPELTFDSWVMLSLIIGSWVFFVIIHWFDGISRKNNVALDQPPPQTLQDWSWHPARKFHSYTCWATNQRQQGSWTLEPGKTRKKRDICSRSNLTAVAEEVAQLICEQPKPNKTFFVRVQYAYIIMVA